MERVILLAYGGLLIGGIGVVLSIKHLQRALRFWFQRGRPYVPGSIHRTALSALFFLLLLFAGGLLGSARWLTRGYQQVNDTTRAGRLRVIDSGAGDLLMEFQADQRHPGPLVIGAGLENQDWRVSGVVVSYPPWARLLGLDAAHHIVASGGPAAEERHLPAIVSRGAGYLSRLPAFLGVSIHRRSLAGRGILPTWTTLMVNREGYFLGATNDPGESFPG